MKRRMAMPLVGVLLAAGAALTACAAGTTTPDASPTDAEALDSRVLSGSGPTDPPGAAFEIAPGSRSVTVAFECDGEGAFSLEVGDSMALGQAPVRGTCGGGPREFSWPVVEKMAGYLVVSVEDATSWNAAPRSSTEEFARDADITADCAAYSPVLSAFATADARYLGGDVDDAGWTELVTTANEQLEALTLSPALGDAVTRLHTAVEDAVATPGRSYGAAAEAVQREIQGMCDANQTPLTISMGYGG